MVKIRLQGTTNEIKRMRRVIERNRYLKVISVSDVFANLFVNDLSLLNRMQKSIESVVVDGHKLNVVSRIPEAAAVAIDYLYYMKNINTSDKKIQSDAYTVLVYDLGHGTFDTSVVRVEEGKTPELLIKDYAEPIGEINFDKVIENELLRKCG